MTGAEVRHSRDDNGAESNADKDEAMTAEKAAVIKEETRRALEMYFGQ